MVNQSWPLKVMKANVKAKDLIFGPKHGAEQGEAKLCISNVSSDLKQILGILAPARLVPSSCTLAPRNTREAGISSSTYLVRLLSGIAIFMTLFS